MGIPIFGAILKGTPLRRLNQRVYLRSSSDDISTVRTYIENAEAAHFWGGLATIPYLAFAWSQEWWSALLSVIVFNLVVNIYPILHLRSVRVRFDHAKRRQRSR